MTAITKPRDILGAINDRTIDLERDAKLWKIVQKLFQAENVGLSIYLSDNEPVKGMIGADCEDADLIGELVEVLDAYDSEGWDGILKWVRGRRGI